MSEIMAQIDAMKRRIKQNRWDNWYGYEGTRRVAEFLNTRYFTAEQSAEFWLKTGRTPTLDDAVVCV